jgi:AcrR family transcriptional regulator
MTATTPDKTARDTLAHDDRAQSPAIIPQRRRRERTDTQKRNAEKLLDAMVAECAAHGLDNLRSARVAAAAKLTTGALYSRYENSDEMLVAMWMERVREPFLAHVANAVQFVRATLPRDHAVRRDIEQPSELIKLGAEFTVLASRNDTVGEVVIPDLVATMSANGITDRCDRLSGAVGMVAASAAVGTALRAIVGGGNPGWAMALVALRASAKHAVALPHEPLDGDLAPLPINTGNPIRDELLTSAKRVVARVGFKGATITRIARRAGFSTSAIYQLWPDKESMLNDAIHEVSVLDYSVNSRSKQSASQHQRADLGFADSWYYGLMPARRVRLDFRLECVIASRHHPATRAVMLRSNDQMDAILRATFPRMPHSQVTAILAMEQALGLGFIALNKFAPSPQRLDYFSYMAALAGLVVRD